MIYKYLSVLSLGTTAVLGTILAAVWWYHFGTHEAYPYIMSVGAILLWISTILAATEKED